LCVQPFNILSQFENRKLFTVYNFQFEQPHTEQNDESNATQQ